jgi:hypothetical protein
MYNTNAFVEKAADVSKMKTINLKKKIIQDKAYRENRLMT